MARTKKNIELSNIAEERKSLSIPKLHKKLKLSMNFLNISIQILLSISDHRSGYTYYYFNRSWRNTFKATTKKVYFIFKKIIYVISKENLWCN